MAYIKIRFGKNLGQMHDRLQRTIDEMFRRVNPVVVLPQQTWRPQMDIYETSEEIIVVGEISGVHKEDLQVELDENAVRVWGRRREVPHVPNMRYHLAEIVYGKFERILMLPAPINPEEVVASYADGLLKITMAKRVRKRVHRVPISEE